MVDPSAISSHLSLSQTKHAKVLCPLRIVCSLEIPGLSVSQMGSEARIKNPVRRSEAQTPATSHMFRFTILACPGFYTNPACRFNPRCVPVCGVFACVRVCACGVRGVCACLDPTPARTWNMLSSLPQCCLKSSEHHISCHML